MKTTQKPSETNFPNWEAWSPEVARADLEMFLSQAEKDIAKVESAKIARYEDLVDALNDATRELYRAWGKVSHMLSVMNSDAWRKVEEEFQPKIIAFSLRVGQSRILYQHAKNLLANHAADVNLDPTRTRILAKMVQGAELAGVALDGDKKSRFNEINAELAKISTDFSNAVLDATKAFSFEKDGKTYTIDDANYPQTMKQCADREIREKLYRARSTRAPENAARISRILSLREELANMLGFANYAERSLATKCAPSIKAVFAMIDELDRATEKIAQREESELGANLQPWDLAYAAERLREKKYAYSEEELKKCFELSDVLAGLWRMTKFLFNVDVEELKNREKPSVWHNDVRVFAVKENNETIAHFYLDPFVRNGLKQGGAWMNEFCGRCDRRNEKPLALIVMNAPLPDENGRTLLTFEKVETLFHEFGHACQHMLTRIGEEGAAGLDLVEWDAVEIASQFMENWCMDDRTGIAIPSDLKEKVKRAKNFRAATACRRQLAFAKTDLQLHQKFVGTANDVKIANFKHFGLPCLPDDGFLNAFSHIFAGGYAAGYYGYKWAEVMSADCYGAFEEAGLANDEAVKRVGEHYRETILALGGSLSAYEVFSRFRMRGPTTKALLRQQGLLND